jgi:tetratricopeptide (TPR) repeat protein
VLLRGRLHLVALAALLLASCGPREAWVDTDADPAPINRLYDGAELISQGRPTAAVASMDALVAEHPASWRARRALQDAHRAALSATEFSALYPPGEGAQAEDALVWYLHGRAVITDPAAALAAFSRAAELDPHRPWPQVGLAYLHYSRGDLFNAVEHYEARLKASPRSRGLRLAAANQYLELRLLVEAQRHLRVALELAPNDPEVQAAMGKAQLGLKNLPRAREWLEGALALEPRMGDAWPMLAELELKSGAHEEADVAYRTSLKLGQPEDAELAIAIRIGMLTRGTR